MGIEKRVKVTIGHLDILGQCQFEHDEFEKVGNFLDKAGQHDQTADFSTQLAPWKIFENLKIMRKGWQDELYEL